MMFSADGVRGASIRATDDTIGSVEDFYFDDATWHIRYLVVDTGGWLTGRKVLIAPAALGHFDAPQRELSVNLTRDQVKGSPDIDTDRPVSRQQEATLHDYYGWSPYWGEGLVPGVPPMGIAPGPAYTGDPVTSRVGRDAVSEARARIEQEPGDPHLRSVQAVSGHYIKAADGDIGHVEDFLIDDANWAIRYMIVDTRNWLPGKKVLVSPQWIDAVDWADNRVRVDLTRDQIKNGPEYDTSQAVDRAYEERLFNFYGRVPYW